MTIPDKHGRVHHVRARVSLRLVSNQPIRLENTSIICRQIEARTPDPVHVYYDAEVAMLARLFVLLLSYLFLIFLVARIFEISSTWLKAGCLASQLLNPFALSVRKLKSILEQRGVSYTGLVEKKELVELVEACGAVTEGENCSVVTESSADDSEEADDLKFTGATHFFEEVEDTKAGTWLVDVIPEGHSSLLRSRQWLSLKRKIARFGIRMGTFRCENDPRLCIKYGWHRPSLVISMPKGNKPKGNVILRAYDSKPSVEFVFRWINKELSSKVVIFNTLDEFKDTFEANMKVNPVYVVLFSKLSEPPLYLGSLSVHFTGRVRFGHVRISDWGTERLILKRYNVDNFPSLMIFTPEGNFTYGHRKGEWIKYGPLELFLRTIHPEVNDVFVTVLLIVNMSCFMELFLMNGCILKRVIHFIWLLTFYNTSLIILCLPAVAMFQLPFLSPVLEYTLKYCRYLMTSEAAAVMRDYIVFGLKHRGIIFGGYIVYGILVRLIRRKFTYHFGSEDDNNNAVSVRDWFSQDLHYLTNVVQSFPSLRQPQVDYSASGLEDGFELLIRRLAVPELWLRPIIPTEYINSLPVWKFCCSQVNHCCTTKQGHCAKKHRKNNNACCQESLKPAGMLVDHECAICLEDFRSGCLLLGLPCGHSYHQECIEAWLCGGTSYSTGRYCCPVCRWPAYKQKTLALETDHLRDHTQLNNN